MKLDARVTMFMTLVATFMVCLVVGDIIGGKLTAFTLFGHEWIISAGQIAFPVTFVLTDILNEFYGKETVRKITYLAFAMVGLTLILIQTANLLPFWSQTATAGWTGINAEAFNRVFSQATKIQFASMFAFLTSNLVDISLFFVFKKMTGNKMLWLRSTGSTAISQIVDTMLINALIWMWGQGFTLDQYFSICVTSYVVKLAAAIIITPLIYALHALIEYRFGIHPAPADVASADIDPPEARARDKKK
ncbi:MAG TPA: queuosine precursor transporter [Kofleriaceae bacterium]